MGQRTETLVMKEFPDFSQPGFDIERYNQRFHNSNVVIHAKSRAVEYPVHWSSLTIKCAFGGQEHYESNNMHYTVDDDHFLVFNNGKMYSSWISSRSEVESFTLNINPSFEQEAVRSVVRKTNEQLDDPFSTTQYDFRFTERLYKHEDIVTRVLRKIRNGSEDESLLFYHLMEDLMLLQSKTNNEIARIDKSKRSTQVEIFNRLIRARDYIHSCYSQEITIEDLAGVACMNTFYFLRQFRNAFGVTPHRFLTLRRMEVAASLLRSTSLPVSEVCIDSGFSDLSSFAKLFRRHYGISPAAFRMYVKS
jgi:AraC-like DNA-binding protein